MSSDARPMIEAQGLCKYYRSFAAIENVTFSIPAGQICAFLGPNGAGKSTTMKILTGFLNPTSGTARIGGHDVHENRLAAAEMIGYLPENGPLYQDMSPKAFLRYCGEVRGMKGGKLDERLDYVAKRCDLEPTAEHPSIMLSLADGRTVSGKLITIPVLRVGKFTVNDVQCAVLGPEAINASPLLGMTFLGNFKFELNAADATLSMVQIETSDTSAAPRRR